MAKVMSDEDHDKLVALLEAMIPKIADLEYELTAYQIAKDNLELRLLQLKGQAGFAVVNPEHYDKRWQVY